MTSGACHRGGPPSWQSQAGVGRAGDALAIPRKQHGIRAQTGGFAAAAAAVRSATPELRRHRLRRYDWSSSTAGVCAGGGQALARLT